MDLRLSPGTSREDRGVNGLHVLSHGSGREEGARAFSAGFSHQQAGGPVAEQADNRNRERLRSSLDEQARNLIVDQLHVAACTGRDYRLAH